MYWKRTHHCSKIGFDGNLVADRRPRAYNRLFKVWLNGAFAVGCNEPVAVVVRRAYSYRIGIFLNHKINRIKVMGDVSLHGTNE